MSELDKDLYQKFNSIKFCIVTGMIPFLEVNVANKKELSETSTVITDIDVLGISIDSSGVQKKILFDCKTLKNVSPINRAFWASGLMQYVAGEEAYIILNKKSSEAHKLSARYLNVYLFDDKQFEEYSSSFSVDFKIDYCYSTSIDSWIKHLEIYKKMNVFNKYGDFINNELPIETDPARGIRRLLVGLDKIKGELNPDKSQHVSIFNNSLLMFTFLMSKIIHELKSVINYGSDVEQFERYVKYYIWGGVDAYNRKQKFKEAFNEAHQEEINPEPELNEWKLFLELVRALLDSPVDTFNCCFLIRELSFRSLVDVDEKKDKYLKDLCHKNNRLKQFVLIQSNYLIKAAKLPKDFYEIQLNSFNQISK